MPTLPRLLDLRRPHSQSLAALAVLFTLLNAVKPLQVDDSAYVYYARQAAAEPSQPYGFEMFWYAHPQPANEILAPPVLPYWIGIAVRLFGENVFLWKLWLLPFSLMFVWSLDFLFRRFANGLETPLTWLTVLSPTFLPSLNLMLDIPALALGLSAVAVFMRAAGRNSLPGTLLAGLLAGLSMQAKYTGLLFPIVLLMYGFLTRQKVLALLAALLAGLLFVGWEIFVAGQHGQSHFLYHLRDTDSWLAPRDQPMTWWQGIWRRIDAKLYLFWPLLPIVGGIGPALVLLGLAALRVNQYIIVFLGGFMMIGYVAVAALEETFNVHTLLPGNADGATFGPLTLEQIIFGVYGVILIGTTVGVLWMLHVGGRNDQAVMEPAFELAEEAEASEFVVPPSGGLGPPDRLMPELQTEAAPLAEADEAAELSVLRRYVCAAARRLDWFLLLWLGLEVAGYFALTPFCAVRRVMGLIVVVTLVLGRRASRTCRTPSGAVLVWAITGGSIALGILFYLVDLTDAFAEKRAAEDAAAYIRQQDPDARIWYVGHWGFQHYAERAGMAPVVPGGFRVEPSLLRRGDWLVKPEWRLNQQMIRVDPERTARVKVLRIQDWIPLRTVQTFYGGFVPLEHHQGPRVVIEVYRVQEDWVPWYYY